MPAHTRCIRCGITGFVRREQVLTRGASETHYYCGRCDHGWATRQGVSAPLHPVAVRNGRPRRVAHDQKRRS